MKTLTLGFLTLLCLNFARSQSVPDSLKLADSLNLAYENRMDEIFDGMDLTQVPSGILYDRGFPFIELGAFDGRITDSSKANSIVFGLSYASITSMIIDSTVVLPNPEGYMSVMDTITPNSDVISVVGLHQIYHQLDTLSLIDSLVAKVDSNLVDVPGRSRSPYIEKELFLFAPVELTANNAIFSLYFDSNHFYSNTGKTISSLNIDVGNGQGYQAINFDQNIPVTFSESGKHNFKVRLTYSDATVYYSHFDIIVREAAFRGVGDEPDIVHSIGILPPEIGGFPGRGAGTVNVYLACGHERIEKPFIWAEAYNPSVGAIHANLTREDIIDRLDHVDGFYEDKSLLDYLTENGYDIIVLDYAYGTDFLPRTAEFIKESIRWVNTQKHSAGSNAKNIILGQSMGGVCTTEALREMENDNEDHEVETFIIFDSPIRGANIPLAAQASLLDMSLVWVNKPLSFDDRYLFQYIDVVKDILTLYYEPATRTMMTQQCEGLKPFGGSTYNPQSIMGVFGFDTDHLYDSYYNYLHGGMGGMPETCEVIAMANGSRKGALGEHEYEAGDLILHADVNNFVIGSIIAGLLDEAISDEDLDIFDSDIMAGGIGLLLWTVGITADIDIKFYAMKDEEDFKYYRHFSFVNTFGITVVSHWNRAFMTDGVEVDNAPGGFFGLQNQGIYFDPESIVADALSTFELHTWCFTPPGSVLNFYDPSGSEDWRDNVSRSYNNPYFDLTFDLTRGLDGYLCNSTEPEFTAEPGVNYKNTAHTWFTSEQTEYLLYNLVGAAELETSLLTYGTTYNYGKSALTPTTDFESSLPIRTSPILDHSLTVNGTKLYVNANDEIGLTPLAEPLANAMDNSHFVMYLGPICDPTPPVVLKLEANGELIIGDGSNRTGSVLVQDGHELVVGETGVVRIKSGSTLKLNEGGILRVNDGGTIIIEDGAELITEYGSVIHYSDGAELQLNGYNSKLVLGGQLHLLTNADFRPIHDGVSSGMIIVNNPDGLINAETGSRFRVIGDGSTDPMLTINEGAKLIAPGNMTQLLFGSCKVLFRSDEDYAVQSFAPFSSVGATYDVQDVLSLEEIHPKIGLFKKSVIVSSDFKDVLVYAEETVASDGVMINVNNSDFDFTYSESDYQLEVIGGNLYMYNCEFTGFSNQAVHLDDLSSYSQITYSDFTAETGSNSIGVYKSAHSELAIKNCDFTEGSFGIYNSFGQISLKCNDFKDHSISSIYGGTYSRVEMSTGHRAGYNKFTDIDNANNVFLNNATFFSISNGYNYFWEDGLAATYTVEGTVNFPAYMFTLPGFRNRWNLPNDEPGSDEFYIESIPSGTEVVYSLGLNTSANCGLMDPVSPPVLPAGSGNPTYLPLVSLTGHAGLTRLDSALAFAKGNTIIWDANANDLDAVTYYEDIIMHPYTATQLADERIQFFLQEAYNDMRFTISHAISDSTILKSNNVSKFDTTVQKYVNVLNHLTSEDTISIDDYRKRFSLEMDKAHLFRMLGHTATGLDILENVNLCELDSLEQSDLNHWLFIYEEQIAKAAIGDSAYGIDTTYTDISGYYVPTSSQATEFYFGSVINSISSVTYRMCSGTKMPEEKDDIENDEFPFSVYPNPSNGIINLAYELPDNMTSQLIVFTPDGKRVFLKELKPGAQKDIIDISNVESGVYIYTVILDGKVEKTGRIAVLR